MQTIYAADHILFIFVGVVVVLKGIYSRSDTNRTGAEGLFFYYHWLLYCPGQMLEVMLLSQHRVIYNCQTSCSIWCPSMGHAIKTWSAVFFKGATFIGEGARLHFCMDEWNRPTPVRRRLRLTQAVRGMLIPTRRALVLDIKAWSLEVFSQYSAFHLWFVHSEARSQVRQGCPKDSVQLARMGVWILVSLGSI